MRSAAYSYDGLDRLTRALTTKSNGSVTADYAYAYDANSNRTRQTATATITDYTYNAADQLTAAGTVTYSYDANGNITANSAGLALSYNAKNQTASITPPGGSAISFAYAMVVDSLPADEVLFAPPFGL